MSVVRPILNAYLRLTEKPHLRRAKDADRLRRAFETKARLLFHAPRSVARADCTLGGRPALDLTAGEAGPIILYFHGGGYVFGSPQTHAAMIARLCRQVNGRAFLPAYRKAPEHPHPAAFEDAEAAYLELLSQGFNPAQLIIGGDSAGGGLTLALVAHLLKQGHTLPAGAFAFSPLTDMTYSGASVQANARAEVILPASRVIEMTEAFIGPKGDRRDPRASPLFADFKGAPPTWLVAGDTEILLEDTRRMASRLRAQGVRVSETIEHDLPHVWPIFHNLLPEARRTLRELGTWITQQTRVTPDS